MLIRRPSAEITMYETLLRPHMVEAPPPLEKVGSVSARLQVADARREEKRLRQIANARLGIERRAAKRKADEDADDEGQEGKRARTDGEATEAGGDKLVSPEDQARDEAEALAEMHATPVPATSTPTQVVHDAASLEAETAEPQKITLSKAFPDVRGHTSYLTFAVLLPVGASGKPEGSALAAVCFRPIWHALIKTDADGAGHLLIFRQLQRQTRVQARPLCRTQV